MIKYAIACAAGLVLASGQSALAGGGPCDADINGDGVVNTLDLGILLADWTLPPAVVCSGGSCVADLNGDSVVNTLDLGILLAAFGTVCNQPTETELAGNSLATYPFFEYVTAFNQGATVQVALDPTRFPSIVGDTASIYIVADKSAAQWASSPALVDLTAGGAMAVTFVGGTIQANTFLVDAGSLSGAPVGTGLGVAYDVVVDMNQNGMLDSNDFIDGLTGAGGMYVVHDLTLPGPLAVTEVLATVTGVTPGFSGEDIFYPTNIAAMGQLPLIIIGHGNGHNYTWYSHIGNHMASYGYIVMSLQNNTGPGVAFAATTQLEHTNAFIGQQATVAGGVLNGHMDANTIVWIGHSRGGEGVALAYDRVFDGGFTPVGWSLASLKLVSSIAPVDFMGGTGNPGFVHTANYHLWTGGSDNDVNGCASCNLCQTFHLHDRAEQARSSISLHGVGHGDFHNGGGSSVATGPCLVGRPTTHQIMRGYLLPLVKYYVEGNVPAKDFIWRQWESFRPIGAPSLANPCVVVDLMHRDGSASGNFMIDDYQAASNPAISSSIGTVTFGGLANLAEGLADDNNTDFTWSVADLMNGMTIGGPGDTTRVVSFEWNAPAFYEESIIPAQQNLTGRKYLSFRAAQTTQHPNTTAVLGDLTFNVSLRDGSGNVSTINSGAYGGGTEEPYQRSGCGAGPGWANEFEVIRIRLTDFLNNGSSLNLSNVVAVRFDFGVPGTSAVGRIGLDEIEVTSN